MPKKDSSKSLYDIAKIKNSKKKWEEELLNPTLKKSPERDWKFTTISGMPIERLYTPEDIEDIDFTNDVGFPAVYPYTRGIHATMYRGRLWTMRQFSGFGTAEETNQRYKYLLKQGQTGLSVAFDLPTLMGRDSDDPLAIGEVGKCGVAIASLKDMETLFDGIPMDKITTSMTINAPAAILLAFYIAVAEKQGADIKKISGTIQNDILKEYIAQKEWIFPPTPSMRIITDIFAFCSQHVPCWNTISISGYHIREAGSTAVQELAFTLYDGIEYVRAAVKTGLDVDEFAPRLSFFFNAHNDFFEELAKYRAARRIWARQMKEVFKAKDERSWLLRFHTQTAGCSLMSQQPYNNVIRTTIQALAAVLGGTQSLHTNSLDETYALPTEEAVTIALRTQQIIAYESGVINTIDPLGGSYFVESLTANMEKAALDYFNKIDSIGGMVPAIERGFPQKEIADAAYQYQKAVEKKEKIIVGVNQFVQDHKPIPYLYIAEEIQQKQLKRIKELRASRSDKEVSKTLAVMKKAAQDGSNLMPFILDAVKSYATIGELCNTLKEVFGEWQEPQII
ncbi:MAG: methylmalonyl-CoA mutase [Candidatus Fischerbacteria bacterium RBG_13_37_8]|uniref:Methylmalonyl-CoA mutase n=1 Tax=Candidatus Fischerbacteria bacterium RBG_13_37_8 TaxID=1817863 RepID=A0A1F5VTV0_9BACT|nr:MAG: methylmalonyl-CoA mutase [Candidatus Fischerbacteria bacterium RBG_13_37_8]